MLLPYQLNDDSQLYSYSYVAVDLNSIAGIRVSGNFLVNDIHQNFEVGNSCYYSVKNLLSSRLLSKNLKIKVYRNIILPVVLYGCETWSLTLRKESRLRVFENGMLRRIFEPKRDEVTAEWKKKLHDEKLYDPYPSPSIVRVIKSSRTRVARMAERRVVYRVLVWKPEGKRLIGRFRLRWEDNI
jgi:hypothetical protein